MMDVVSAVKNGFGIFDWYEVVSEYNGNKLYIKVFRDAMKFNGVPALTWNFKRITGDVRTFDGVRLPASAHQLQEIADLLGCMLMTPKVIDLIWLQAGTKFDAVINVNGKIVAITNIHDLHTKVESEVGTDDGVSLISCVGKYWCLTNELSWKPSHGNDTAACNYGWFARHASGPCLSPGTQCWQRPGFGHGKSHFDPSQVIRLMHRKARLISSDGTEQEVDLHDIAADSALAPLLHHQGILTYLRQKGVVKLPPLPTEAPEPVPDPEPTPEPIPEIKSEPEPEPTPKNKGWLKVIWDIIRKLLS